MICFFIWFLFFFINIFILKEWIEEEFTFKGKIFDNELDLMSGLHIYVLGNLAPMPELYLEKKEKDL